MESRQLTKGRSLDLKKGTSLLLRFDEADLA
jgi:hypothetical protein